MIVSISRFHFSRQTPSYVCPILIVYGFIYLSSFFSYKYHFYRRLEMLFLPHWQRCLEVHWNRTIPFNFGNKIFFFILHFSVLWYFSYIQNKNYSSILVVDTFISFFKCFFYICQYSIYISRVDFVFYIFIFSLILFHHFVV